MVILQGIQICLLNMSGKICQEQFLENFNQQTNNIITLDPDLEQTIMDSVQQSRTRIIPALDPETTQRIFENLVKKYVVLVQLTAAYTSYLSNSKNLFKRLSEQVTPDLIVLSYNEIDPSIEIQSIGMVSIA